MPQLVPKSIYLRNWTTVAESEVTFPEYGVVFVEGDNRTSMTKTKSVGAGKTALGEALSRALFGVPGRFTSLGDYSRDGNGDTYVRVTAELAGKPLIVELGYKCAELSKTGEGLRFTYDGQVVERNHINATREELCAVIGGITPKLASWTIFLDGEKLRFNELSQQDSVNIIMSALNQPPWTDYHDNAKKIAQRFRAETKAAQRALDDGKQAIGDAQELVDEAVSDLEEAKTDYQSEIESAETVVQSKQEAITRLETQLRAKKKELVNIRKEIKDAETEDAKRFKTLELKRGKLRSELAVLRRAASEKQGTKSAVEAKRRVAKSRLEELESEPDNCPTCGKPWNKVHGAKEIGVAEKQLQIILKSFKVAKAEVESAEERVQAHEDRLEEVDNQISQLRSGGVKALSVQFEECGRSIEQTTAKLAAQQVELEKLKGGPDKSHVVKCTTVVEERRGVLTRVKSKLKTLAQNVAESEVAVRVGDYWVEAYGPTGIPNMILREAVPQLNSVSDRMSAEISGGILSVGYATTRELAKGGGRSELVITVKNRYGSRKIEGNSKGETGLTGLIISDTLSEVGSIYDKVGYRWYDEAINAQDPVVRNNILERIKLRAHQHKTLVFLVDHYPDMERYADYKLVAEKQDKTTSYRWG